ncbi:MAG: 23S rRNA (adenine(2503)-C(2))-methyltransferase RlmN [Oscillospiraceae bacterium]|nr:23S rRNA (adenine(2503)-C(2))-methyltransferase RlmN [Oscillospiraceae bacterium]
MDKMDIKSMSLEQLEKAFKGWNYRPYHALQVYAWLHRGVESFDDMTDISKQLRGELEKQYEIFNVSIVEKLTSKCDETIKYLLSLRDGALIESVLMKYHHGYTICISTQVGCKMGCVFCATGKMGFSRNLTASEMLSQIQSAQADLGIRISNVVLMGMGEPLDNYENTLIFLKLAASQKGMNIGMRHISVSTCGIIDKINDLAQRNISATLSVSLHAPNNEIRDQILPINKKFPVEELLSACRDYAQMTKRRVTYEYTMINNLNDSALCAKELANKIGGSLCHVNIIPINQIDGNNCNKSQHDQIKLFCDILLKKGISVTTRRSLGSDINASCGQLRARVKTSKILQQ